MVIQVIRDFLIRLYVIEYELLSTAILIGKVDLGFILTLLLHVNFFKHQIALIFDLLLVILDGWKVSIPYNHITVHFVERVIIINWIFILIDIWCELFWWNSFLKLLYLLRNSFKLRKLLYFIFLHINFLFSIFKIGLFNFSALFLLINSQILIFF